MKALERTVLALMAWAAACGSLAAQDTVFATHMAADTSVARQTAAWVTNWTPEKRLFECVATHVRGADSTWAWVQDSIVAYADTTGCAPGLGVIVVLSDQYVRLGSQRVLPFLGIVAQNRGWPWFCGVIELRPMQIEQRWVLMPVEWCAYRNIRISES